FATKLAQQCGQIILEASKTRHTTGNKVFEKFGQQQIKTERKISGSYVQFIGEETKAAGNNYEFTNKPTWIIDPIDGTTNFVQGFPFVAVSIGLTINKEPVVGVVFNPFLNELFTARKGHGAFLNHTIRLPLSHPYPPSVLPSSLSQCLVAYEYSATRSDLILNKKISSVHNLLRSPGKVSWSSKKAGAVRGVRCLCSAALSICYLAKGCLDIHYTNAWEWDVAAALVIL
ncbi:2996_t:CDS:2, partial [Dentiscutata erythropus]